MWYIILLVFFIIMYLRFNLRVGRGKKYYHQLMDEVHVCDGCGKEYRRIDGISDSHCSLDCIGDK